jgi:protein TonB
VDEPPVLPEIEEPGPIGPVAPVRGGEPDATGRGTLEPSVSDDPDPNTFVWTDELPQLVRSVKPFYPDLAREAGVEGTVKLQLLVGLDGRVLRAIVRPGGSVPMLDQAAIDAALRCVFTPALANGRPVKVWVTQDYRFRLH